MALGIGLGSAARICGDVGEGDELKTLNPQIHYMVHNP